MENIKDNYKITGIIEGTRKKGKKYYASAWINFPGYFDPEHSNKGSILFEWPVNKQQYTQYRKVLLSRNNSIGLEVSGDLEVKLIRFTDSKPHKASKA
ncbi:MAG: hypothetical protein ABIH63_04040 [archaeon]